MVCVLEGPRVPCSVPEPTAPRAQGAEVGQDVPPKLVALPFSQILLCVRLSETRPGYNERPPRWAWTSRHRHRHRQLRCDRSLLHRPPRRLPQKTPGCDTEVCDT